MKTTKLTQAKADSVAELLDETADRLLTARDALNGQKSAIRKARSTAGNALPVHLRGELWQASEFVDEALERVNIAIRQIALTIDSI